MSKKGNIFIETDWDILKQNENIKEMLLSYHDNEMGDNFLYKRNNYGCICIHSAENNCLLMYSIKDYYCKIEFIIVKEEERNNGIGTSLVSYIIKKFKHKYDIISTSNPFYTSNFLLKRGFKYRNLRNDKALRKKLDLRAPIYNCNLFYNLNNEKQHLKEGIKWINPNPSALKGKRRPKSYKIGNIYNGGQTTITFGRWS